jgi:bifunctional DNA-binding transcriptional regulator/antitoxin component of YhaV-PrlF toxin-antitoxin module
MTNEANDGSPTTAERDDLRARWHLAAADLSEISALLTDPAGPLTNGLLDIVASYGGVAAINSKIATAGRLEARLARLRAEDSPYLTDLDWLTEQRDRGAFVTLPEYRRDILGPTADSIDFNEANAVTLEISALNFFPWLISQAQRAIERRQLMPARYIRVRNMAEQAAAGGDIVAVAAAMQIIGATHVETLDTRGIDGSNVMLGGAETITGYFGGIGQPNEYPLRWVDEYLHYATEYGIRQVLNINPGTVLAALLLHRLGVDNEFKVSVFMGVDNPFAVLWLLMAARLLARPDGSTSLAGLNLSNSVNADTLRSAAALRDALGLKEQVRLEHHVTEAYKAIVRQPYERRAELVEVAADVANLSAKHEGGEPAAEAQSAHPSDILEYFLPQDEIARLDLMPALADNYLAKHESVNLTAAALTRAGIGVLAASALHHRA